MAAAPRSSTINLRIQTPQRALIDQAARVAGKNRTDFMLEAAFEKAQQVLLNQTVCSLDAEQFSRFEQVLDAPVERLDALNDLLRRKAPWDL